jgi:LysM repeat protein
MNTLGRAQRAVTTGIAVTAGLVFAALPASPAQAHQDPSPVNHTVRSGDTVWDLARSYGTSVQEIIEANKLGPRAIIVPGQQLTIPSTTSSPTPSSSGAPASTTHRVTAGDTVWDLARAYGTSVQAIVAANGLGPAAVIRIDQYLVIPGATARPGVAASTATTTSEYTVRAGDTLSGIAARFGTSVDAIAQANAIANPSLIRIGQTLTIAGSTSSNLVPNTFLGRTYPEHVVAAANANKSTLNAMDVPTRSQMQAMVVRIANEMGVDPALAQAVAYQESGFSQRAVSPANAVGCMQVIPSSGEWASDLVGRDLDLLVAEDNVTAGIAILKVLQRDGIPLETAIAGYYQGETSVKKRGMNQDTVAYVASVIALMDRFE